MVNFTYNYNLDTIISIVTKLWAGRFGVRFMAESSDFLSTKRPDLLWSLPSLLLNGYMGLLHRGRMAGNLI